jgi:tetratricopeptide (TPR) repeat protein
MREETEGSTGWYRLGELMISLGQFNKTEELFEILLKQTTDEGQRAMIFNNLGRMIQQQGKYTEAITIYEKALEIYQKALPANHPHLATFYNNIGLVYMNTRDYSKALSHYEKALEIYQKALPTNNPDLAISYNNIGGLYTYMNEYSKALSYYEKAFEILKKLFQQIILIWLIVTTTSGGYMRTMAITRKHSHIMNVL